MIEYTDELVRVVAKSAEDGWRLYELATFVEECRKVRMAPDRLVAAGLHRLSIVRKTDSEDEVGPPISLDMRITAQAAEAIMHNSRDTDRWMLRIDEADRGKVHSWTDQYGVTYEQVLNVEVIETTPIVQSRRSDIEAAVEANRG